MVNNIDNVSPAAQSVAAVQMSLTAVHMTTVTAEANISVNANVTTSISSDGQLSKTFNGIDIGIGVKGTATGTDNVQVTGMATTTFGGKDYGTGLQGPDGSKSLIQQTGPARANSISGDIFIPASNIYAEKGPKIFPGANVSGAWQNVRDDGSGSVPVTGRVDQSAKTYNFQYSPYTPIKH